MSLKLDRRGFLTGAAATGAFAASGGLSGCSSLARRQQVSVNERLNKKHMGFHRFVRSSLTRVTAEKIRVPSGVQANRKKRSFWIFLCVLGKFFGTEGSKLK